MDPVQFHTERFLQYCQDTNQQPDEIAEDMWGELHTCRNDVDNPFDLINYSAGVYAGLYESNDADAIAVLPDLSNLQFVTDNTDLWAVLERMDNPDAHADGAEDALTTFGSAVMDTRDECPDRKVLEPALHAFMRVACPEYTVVLRAWNPGLTDEEFWQWHDETHSDTFFGNIEYYV
jgi:hypothetical protein